MIRFNRLPGRPADWDTLIRAYPSKLIFHEGAWLDHALSIHPEGRIEYFEILRDGKRVGLHCGLRITRMLIPIHGSPLGGTGTNYMGPLTDADVDQGELLTGLTALLGPRHYLHMEVAHPSLDPGLMLDHGFKMDDSVTHVVPVPNDVEAAWGGLRSEARNRIRKSEKQGVVVEATTDPAIVDQFYEQFGEVYGKQGMVRPFGPERARSLYDNLFPAGRLLPLWARRGDDILAAGLFPYDEKCIYFWGAGSWLKYHQFSPNEALQWGVIKFAAERGIPSYNMCGGTSQFKNKFGGADVPHRTYHKSALPLLEKARQMYKDRHFRSLRKPEQAAAGDAAAPE